MIEAWAMRVRTEARSKLVEALIAERDALRAELETRDYHNEIRAERDKLREKLAMAREAILEARPYVPEHHGPVNHKIETTLAAISDA